MVPGRVVAWGILASIFVWTGQASAGWVIEHAVKGGAVDSRYQVLLQANRMKTLIFGEGGDAVVAFITDLNAETITQVDYQERHYFTATLKEYVQTFQGAMAGAAKAMEEATKEMSPQERAMAQQMLPGLASQACREPKIEMRRSGQQATIAGYQAVRYDILIDGKPESELWIAKGLPAWRELDAQKLERFGAEMTKLAGCGSTEGRQGLLGDDPSWKVANEGYPVRTVDKSGSGVTTEVVKAESRTLPASEFRPPAGFARKTFLEVIQKQ